MTKFNIIMISVDRSGGTNYIDSTFQHLNDSGIFKSNHFGKLTIYDSGSASVSYLDSIRSKYDVAISTSEKRIKGNANFGRALIDASNMEYEWIIFLEDDIETCSNFLESVHSVLGKIPDNIRIVSLYSAYPESMKLDFTFWEYPIHAFYGTQGFIIRKEDAASLGTFIIDIPDNGWDLLMKKWSLKYYPNQTYFYDINPSIIQHIGETSYINSTHHISPTYKGKEWSLI